MRPFPRFLLLAAMCCILMLPSAFAQDVQSVRGNARVREDGMMYWSGTGEEVRLFGVNYTAPFAYSYRALQRLGLSHKQAIDLDVEHLARLGFDAYRIHVWDREVSDSTGRLLENEHIDLLDYLLLRLSEKGIVSVLTPIAWWGTGWPEPDLPTPGFSTHRRKEELVTDPEARKAQVRYLTEFVQHVNPYRKLAYKDDPYIIAMEVINEPGHPDDSSMTTAYINEMVDAMRGAGYFRPIFYNISQNWSDIQAPAVARANIDGVTFQWYPTGLVHNQSLQGSYLRNVASYPIPAEGVDGFASKARLVYEFDAADIPGSYMYPAMARSFREAGMQFAAMFSYDPVQIAWSNTEYPTHFVNLLYAPGKAISLMIAGEAFRRVPHGKTFGPYPANNAFDVFRVSAEEDLSEMNTPETFLYSNSTSTMPKAMPMLRRIAGVGNSPVVRYDGTGAYFLDRLGVGVWRLEVEPDVVWLRDPLRNGSMSRQAARLYWKSRNISVSIAGLGKKYQMTAWSEGAESVAADDGHMVTPGIYLMTASDVPEETVGKFLETRPVFLAGLYRPEEAGDAIHVIQRGPQLIRTAAIPPLTFDIVAGREVDEAFLYLRRPGWRGFEKLRLDRRSGFRYAASDTSRTLYPGVVEYCVSVRMGSETVTFPSGNAGAPGDWDYSADDLWHLTIVGNEESITLMDPLRDQEHLAIPRWSRDLRMQADIGPGRETDGASLLLRAGGAGVGEWRAGLQRSLSHLTNVLGGEATREGSIVLEARSVDGREVPVRIVLLRKDGGVVSAEGTVGSGWTDLSFPLGSFKAGEGLLLPNAYPHFLPEKVRSIQGAPPETHLSACETLQILVGPADGSPAEGRWDVQIAIGAVRWQR